jgi:hypothetical protein
MLMFNKPKRTLLAIVAAPILMVSLAVTPAFAFIHDYIPAGYCPQPAAHEAADNETAEAQLPRVPIAEPPAPTWCPGNGH